MRTECARAVKRTMIRRQTLFSILILSVLAVPQGPARADLLPEDVLDPGPANEPARGAVRWERGQTDVLYLRPEADFEPDGSIEIKIPEKPKQVEVVRSQNRWGTIVVFGLILAVLAYLIWRHGNAINVTFSARKEKKGTQAAEGGAVDPAALLPKEGLLEYLAAMKDRREALILLTSEALERAAATNGVTLARAQTARDVVRVLPRSWMHLAAVRKLVRETEIAHFGGRDVSEDTWQACLDAARPLFSAAPA